MISYGKGDGYLADRILDGLGQITFRKYVVPRFQFAMQRPSANSWSAPAEIMVGAEAGQLNGSGIALQDSPFLDFVSRPAAAQQQHRGLGARASYARRAALG